MTASTVGSEDLLKVLHKLGYPEVEEGAKPSSLLPKVITCCTKKLKKLSDLLPSEPAAQEPREATDDADKDKEGNETSKNALAQKSDSQNHVYPSERSC